MKKTIYLHVGHPKTGSSSLQKFLAANQTALKEQDFSYPICLSGQTNHHFLFLEKVLATQLNSQIKWNYTQINTQRLSIMNDFFYQSLKKVTTSNIILSHESFIYGLDKLLPYFLKDFNVVVIAYFRRMDHFVESFYSELTVNGSQHLSIDEHINKNFEKLYLNRYKIIHDAAEILGNKNIIIRPYEKGQLENQNITDDFMATLNIKYNANFKNIEQNFNPSVPIKFIHFNRLLSQALCNRNYFIMPRKVNRQLKFLAQKNTDNKKEGSLLSYEQRMRLINQTKALDEKIAQLYLKREHGLLFYEKLPNADLQASQDVLSAKEIAELMADFLLAHPPILEDVFSENYISHRYEFLLKKIEENS
ncbi:MAG: hypothetical protein V4496_04115 [Pseudomonadota bacterium]